MFVLLTESQNVISQCRCSVLRSLDIVNDEVLLIAKGLYNTTVLLLFFSSFHLPNVCVPDSGNTTCRPCTLISLTSKKKKKENFHRLQFGQCVYCSS